MQKIRSKATGVLMVILIAVGCTSVNTRLSSEHTALEARIKNDTRATTLTSVEQARSFYPTTSTTPTTAISPVEDQDGFFVGLAISGGGSRSANFGAACMFQLQRMGLLQRVDYISAVSGGSLTAAYYCLYGEEWNPGEVQRRLTYPFANDLLLQTLLPWNIIGMSVTDLDRSDLLANTFRSKLFTRDGRELTFADLREDRPRLLINATDLQSGRRFLFTNESFDQLNSDLSTFPIAYAVTASSAVPVLLHQVTLTDHSTTFKQYRHLIDGGVSDNLGVQALVDTYTAHLASARANGQESPYPNGAILYVIDAGVPYDAQLATQPDTGLISSLIAGTRLTSTALLNRVSTATLAELIVNSAEGAMSAAQLRYAVQELKKQGYLELPDLNGRPMRVVHLALSRVGDLSDLPFEGFSESINNISTYFNIDQEEATHLYTAAELLVQEKFQPQLQELTKQMQATP